MLIDFCFEFFLLLGVVGLELEPRLLLFEDLDFLLQLNTKKGTLMFLAKHSFLIAATLFLI